MSRLYNPIPEIDSNNLKIKRIIIPGNCGIDVSGLEGWKAYKYLDCGLIRSVELLFKSGNTIEVINLEETEFLRFIKELESSFMD